MLGFVPLRGGEGEVWTPESLAHTGANALLYFDVEKFSELEARFGVHRMEEVLGLLDSALIDLWERRQFVTAAFRSFGDDYFVLVQVVGEEAEDVVRAARAIAEFVRDELVAAVSRSDPEVGAELRFHVSAVPLLHFSPENAARFLYSAVKRALTFVKVPRAEETQFLHSEISAIVEEGNIRVLFQPIFRLDTKSSVSKRLPAERRVLRGRAPSSSVACERAGGSPSGPPVFSYGGRSAGNPNVPRFLSV